MAKTNRRTGTSTIISKSASAEPSKPIATVSKSNSPQSPARTQSGDKLARAGGPTHQQIADRAKQIWRQKGCPAGQDQTNWFEAEAQLKRELVVR